MIREEDLREAIAECQGKRNPDASTCIKLSAYYTILREMFPQGQDDGVPVIPARSFASAPEEVEYEGDSEFAQLCRERSVSHIMPILDELMDVIKVTQPRLYEGVMRRLKEA